MSKLSFLEEISDNDLQSYTPAQLSQILTQRAHVLDMVKEPNNSIIENGTFQPTTPNDRIVSLFPKPSLSPSRMSTKPAKKPWLPRKDGECQFMCCHSCRPSLHDKCFLSLDGIANGDIPATAITGYGFHVEEYRPVADVKLMRNIGLRPSPPPSSVIAATRARRFSRARSTASRRSASHGLGISNHTLQLSRSRSKPTAPNHITSDVSIGNGDAYSLEVQQAFKHMALSPHRRKVLDRSLSGIVKFEVACLTPLPPQTGEELTAISAPLTATRNSEVDSSLRTSPQESKNSACCY